MKKMKFESSMRMGKRFFNNFNRKNDMAKIKTYHLGDADFARLCGIELTENSSEEVMVDNNGRVINLLNNGGEKNED